MAVYLVEDSPVLRQRITRAIEGTGALEVVGSAGRAHQAVDEIQALQPDIVVLDLQLEDGTGWDVLAGAGHVPRHIVILTNHGAEPFRQAARERGCAYFFDKTTEFDGFLSTLQTLAPDVSAR